MASRFGHLDVVRVLLQNHRVDPSAKNNDALRLASKNGHVDVVELLRQNDRVTVGDPTVNDNRAIPRNVHPDHCLACQMKLDNENGKFRWWKLN